MKNFLMIGAVVLAIVNQSCSENKADQSPQESYTTIEGDKPILVKVILAEEKDFHFELLSNGTIQAMRKAELRFQTQDIVTNIYVKNGTKVSKGQVIAELDKFKLESNFFQSIDAKEKASLELQDVLIGQGYSLKDSVNVPSEVMRIAKIRSNYDNSVNNYRVSKYNLDMATLRAPFSGVVANLNIKEHNNTGGDPFCTIIDNQNPEVVFNILENEIILVNLNDKVLVSSFSSPDYIVEGRVTEINPMIDKNGMVEVKASISNKENKFYEGMNVKVRLQRTLGKRITVPKSALLLRNNRKVVFTVNNGKAVWNYVETAQENSESYVVSEGINRGDSVIYEGNLNLAHESIVTIEL